MAFFRHLASLLAAIVSVIPFRNGSVLEAGSVSSIYVVSCATLTLCFVRNHLEYDVPNCRFASLYVNSSTWKNPAKAKVKAALRTIVSYFGAWS